jgi:hypothetical protein
MSQIQITAQQFGAALFAKWQLKRVPVYLFFYYRKAGSKVGMSQREGRERQLYSTPGSGMDGKKNIFWRKRQRRNDTLRIDDRGRRDGGLR